MRDSLGRERLVPRARLVLLVALAAAAIGALLLRVVSIVEPLGIDQSLWASAVRGIARGQRLYADVWEQRPPGIYWIYLAGFSVFGWTPAAVAWLDILASAACTLLLFVIGRRHGHASTGLVAAMLYATLTMPAWLYRHHGFLERSVSETFIALCVAASACLALRVRDRSSLTAAAGVGLFAGAAAVFKPNAILYLPALLAWIAVYAWGGRAPAISRPWRLFAVAVITAAIVPALAIVWLWRLGVIGDASVAVIEFNRFYVSQGLTPGGLALAFSKAVWFRMKSDPLWLAGSVAAAIAVYDLATKRQLAPIPGLAVLWGGAAALVILVNGIRLYNSYFIQALAPLALLSACMLTDAVRSTWPRRLIAAVTAALMLALLVERHYAARVLDAAAIDFQVLRGEVDQRAFLERFGGYNNGRGYSARANLELAEYVRGRTHPDDRIYLFGISGAGVYFDSDRLTAHRFLRVNFFVPRSFPDPSFDLQAVCRDLARQRPRYIIFERLHSSQDTEMRKAADSLSDHPDVQELLRPYRLETTIEDFTLYRLSD